MDDLPLPDSPVITTSWSRGISRSTFCRLCSRAPRTVIMFGSPAGTTGGGLRAACRGAAFRGFGVLVGI